MLLAALYNPPLRVREARAVMNKCSPEVITLHCLPYLREDMVKEGVPSRLQSKILNSRQQTPNKGKEEIDPSHPGVSVQNVQDFRF
jgi:hypothetical protein